MTAIISDESPWTNKQTLLQYLFKVGPSVFWLNDLTRDINTDD